MPDVRATLLATTLISTFCIRQAQSLQDSLRNLRAAIVQ
jgi:hypothetical protein